MTVIMRGLLYLILKIIPTGASGFWNCHEKTHPAVIWLGNPMPRGPGIPTAEGKASLVEWAELTLSGRVDVEGHALLHPSL